MPIDDKLLAETFKEELESLLAIISDNLLELEEEGQGDQFTKRIEEIARSGRNIKVSAGAIGANDVGVIAQHIERLFTSLVTLSPELIDITKQAVLGMRETMQAFMQKKNAPTNCAELIQRLEQLPVVEAMKKVELPTIVEEKIDENLIKQIVEVFKAELEEKLLVITNGLLELEANRDGDKDLTKVIDEMFRAAHNIKGSGRGVGALDLGEIAHHIETIFSAIKNNTLKSNRKTIDLCLEAVDAMRIAMQCYSEGQPLPFDLSEFLGKLDQCLESEPLKKSEPIRQVAKGQISSAKSGEFESIRVSLGTLDRVSALMEEMQISKIAVEDHYTDIVKLNRNVQNNQLSQISTTIERMRKEMRVSVNALRVTFDALQDEVRLLRLVPVTLQLGTLPRIVRDLAYDLNKQVSLEIQDHNVKMDKMVLDGLKDPIVHILRNSIDHGMEDAAFRKSVGKPEQGLISIAVSEEGSNILFKISDDGAGLNLEKIKQTALKKGILSVNELESLSKEDLIDLIFRPGFSTKELATEVSGRGVGLDAVRSNLSNLKGKVSVTTEVGKGTTFYLRVPLTLATERGLIVRSSGQLFLIINSSIERLLLSKRKSIVNVEGSQAVLLNKQPILLSTLSEIFNLEEKAEKRGLWPTVIIKDDKNRLALIVDEILGEKEIVLKPLQALLSNNPSVIGATLTGSNQIIFVLNSAYLITKAIQSKKKIS